MPLPVKPSQVGNNSGNVVSGTNKKQSSAVEHTSLAHSLAVTTNWFPTKPPSVTSVATQKAGSGPSTTVIVPDAHSSQNSGIGAVKQ